jgi:hypothetical protein
MVDGQLGDIKDIAAVDTPIMISRKNSAAVHYIIRIFENEWLTGGMVDRLFHDELDSRRSDNPCRISGLASGVR